MNKKTINFYIIIGLRIGIALLLLSSLFKILHFDFSFELLCIGSMLTFVFYLTRTLLKFKRTIPDWVKLLFVLCLCSRTILRLGHLPITSQLENSLSIVYLAALVYLFYTGNIPRISSIISTKFSRLLFGIGIGFILLGAMFKIMHWPGAVISLVIGTFVLIMWLIIEPIIKHFKASREECGVLLDDFSE